MGRKNDAMRTMIVATGMLCACGAPDDEEAFVVEPEEEEFVVEPVAPNIVAEVTWGEEKIEFINVGTADEPSIIVSRLFPDTQNDLMDMLREQALPGEIVTPAELWLNAMEGAAEVRGSIAWNP